MSVGTREQNIIEKMPAAVHIGEGIFGKKQEFQLDMVHGAAQKSSWNFPWVNSPH